MNNSGPRIDSPLWNSKHAKFHDNLYANVKFYSENILLLLFVDRIYATGNVSGDSELIICEELQRTRTDGSNK